MISSSDHQRINQLLGELGGYLDSYRRPSVVTTAYTKAQNSLTTGNAAGSFHDLAEKLREAARIADALAELNANH